MDLESVGLGRGCIGRCLREGRQAKSDARVIKLERQRLGPIDLPLRMDPADLEAAGGTVTDEMVVGAIR